MIEGMHVGSDSPEYSSGISITITELRERLERFDMLMERPIYNMKRGLLIRRRDIFGCWEYTLGEDMVKVTNENVLKRLKKFSFKFNYVMETGKHYILYGPSTKPGKGNRCITYKVLK